MMQCETCNGIGKILYVHDPIRPQRASDVAVCPTCNGTGIASCCDGAVGGPDEVTNTGTATAHPALEDGE